MGAPGSAPLSVPEHPPRFPDPPVRRTGNTVERPISAPPPLSEGLGGRGKREGPFGTASDGDGSAHRRPERWRTAGGAGLLTPPPNPAASARTPIPHRLGIRRGTSQARRDDLSEGWSPESALHRPRGRWGAAGNRPPPIFESGEAPMAATEEGGKRGESSEGSPLRPLKRSEGRKTSDRSELARSGEGRVSKFGSPHPKF